jgi:hypothetical protein
MTKHMTEEPEEKRLFGIMVSEGSVCGYLAPCIWQSIMVAGVCGRGAPSPHSGQEAKRVDTRRGQNKT